MISVVYSVCVSCSYLFSNINCWNRKKLISNMLFKCHCSVINVLHLCLIIKNITCVQRNVTHVQNSVSRKHLGEVRFLHQDDNKFGVHFVFSRADILKCSQYRHS